ncbi:MAG: hypothetical protein HQ534_05830 [Armatimonadetes bacterium]|nr:hypothetical protein [Armatimonadota bacterium]
MKSGILRKKTSRRNRFLKIYFVVGSLFILMFFIIYTNILLTNIRKDVQVVPDLYSKFIGLPDNVNMEQYLSQYVIEEIMPRVDYPTIFADSSNVPFSWENIGIENIQFSKLDIKQQKIIRKKMRKMAGQKHIIPLKYDLNSDEVMAYFYYGETRAIQMLKMMPYIEISLIIIFVFLGIYGVIILKKNERDIIWVGLAKETAHQFGTPLSSLGGWLNILSLKLQEKKDDPKMQEILQCMNADIDRLNKIASRFGKVGSILIHQKTNLHDTILETVELFKKRLPSISKKITIKFESEIENKEIKIDPDLIKWTLENIIKNSIDAMQNNAGEIAITAFSLNRKAYIRIKDEGTGMQKSMYKQVFVPGITSKKRGWGLGLSLAKRIIEEYHNGKIRVLESEINKGTTFEIVLPEE